jgi:hypothetical protein
VRTRGCVVGSAMRVMIIAVWEGNISTLLGRELL